jgi:hypothetical protein
MYKVNMNHEVMGLKKNEIEFYQPLFTEGVIVERKNISQYIRQCYVNSKNLELGIFPVLKYDFFLDKINNCCILFTECLVEDYEDNFEVDLKEDYIVVKIYKSPEEFMAGSLASHFRDLYVGDELSKWDEFGYYTNNCVQYNEISIVKAISELKPSKKIVPLYRLST